MSEITIENIEWALKVGSIYGLGFVAIAGILSLIFYGTFFGIRSVLGLIDDVRKRWLPRVVDEHVSFVATTKEATTATREAVEKLAVSHGVSRDNHSKTHRALAYVVEALQSGDVCDEARDCLRRAIAELRD